MHTKLPIFFPFHFTLDAKKKIWINRSDEMKSNSIKLHAIANKYTQKGGKKTCTRMNEKECTHTKKALVVVVVVIVGNNFNRFHAVEYWS